MFLVALLGAIFAFLAGVGVFWTLIVISKKERGEKEARDLARSPFDDASVTAWIVQDDVMPRSRDWEPFRDQPDYKRGTIFAYLSVDT